MDSGLRTIKLSELPEAATLNESDYSLIVQNGTSKKIKGLLLKGNAGDNGKSTEIQKTDTHIQWRQEGGQWINLVALADLKGDKGDNGDKGDKGDKGEAGVNGRDGADAINPTFTIGTVTALPSNSDATVTLTGTYPNLVLNFGIPRGADGSGGGSVSQEDIITAVNNYLTEHPVQNGATAEQAAQIEANKTAIGDENSGLIKKVNDIKNTELQNLNTAILRVNETVGNKSELPVGDANIIASINRIDRKTTTGNGLTSEQSQQLQTAYEHSQSDHVTMDEVNAAISNAQLGGGEVDLSAYATKTYADNAVSTALDGHTFKFLTQSEYDSLETKDPLVEYHITDATEPEIIDTTSFASDLSLTGTSLQLKNSSGNLIGTAITLPSSGSTESIPTKVSQLENDSNYATESYVTNAINNAQLGGSGSGTDLNIYATKEEVAKITEENHNFLNEKVSVSNNKNVQFLYDVEGNPINCHGMGILYYDGVYYAYGESKTGETKMGSTGYEFIETTGINCYSSTDLVNWKFENKVIKPNEDDTESIIHKSKVLERPKCVYNEKNNNFVLMWHADNEAYSFSQIGFATCDTPTGEFTVIGSSRPTTNATSCRDFTVFVDDDKKAYAFISQDNNKNMYAHLLNDDYTGFTTTYAQVIGNNQLREAPAVFKYNNEYYILSSGCTGWNPNPSKIHKSSTILGTYEEQNNPCKNDTDLNSYGSQSTYVIKVDPNKFNCEYIACFDQWNKTDLEASTYLWLPLVLDESDSKFYVDNVNNKAMYHIDEIRNRKYLISDPTNYFYNKTIDQAIQSLYELLQNSTPSEPIVATGLTVSPSEATVFVGKNKTFTCTVTPTTATSSTAVEWSIDNSNATIVASGKTCTVTGVTAGSSVLTATAGSLTSTATITIEQSSTPVNRVFAINSESYASESNTLTDLDNGLVATLVGTPTVSNNMINFTTSDTFSFDISSLSLTDFTLRFIYQYATRSGNSNIITIGQGLWANSFTFYQRDAAIVLNGDSASISNNTVGSNNLSAVANVIINNIVIGSDAEIVLSYNSSTRDIRVWVNGTLVQDGTVSKDIYTSLTKLCNTEGKVRFVGGYKLIELYDEYYSSYPEFI